MSIVKLNNRSVKDITAFGSISSLGSLTHIATQTASSSASLSFTSGIDSTYKEYIFYIVNIHSASEAQLQVGFRDGGSDYDAIKTTTAFRAYHFESGSGAGVGYQASEDLAQSTSFQRIGQYQSSSDNDSNGSGYLHLFNPSSTVFVKHFISNYTHHYTNSAPGNIDNYIAGYCNTTTAIDGVQFKFDSGNIDAGTIKLYGIKGS